MMVEHSPRYLLNLSTSIPLLFLHYVLLKFYHLPVRLSETSVVQVTLVVSALMTRSLYNFFGALYVEGDGRF